ncbi:MAG: ECF-type sigma factor [Steroidobacteraceae bacterium]
MGEFTRALDDLRAGRSTTDAVNELFRATYGELKQLARASLRRNAPITTLDTTAVVHESYLRFLNREGLALEDRRHFLIYAARVMRSVVVDMTRRRCAARRDGGTPVTLRTDLDAAEVRDEELLRVDEALTGLERIDPQLARIVEMRYFAGFTVDEVASHLDTSARTIARQWNKARLLLMDALREA